MLYYFAVMFNLAFHAAIPIDWPQEVYRAQILRTHGLRLWERYTSRGLQIWGQGRGLGDSFCPLRCSFHPFDHDYL